ncbi:PREDICTED: cysteine-rich receptor-like protein kinase 25 [Populus euphratica]|uniref:Cysteine-rich receptor-like protein kinase 25 n=1 Tax=Populus euphratica TaxID=75702 RepID=A0AAJ6TBX6_POPEU|nr:PREDICTED: cysteine-rich receptor-like protein kinase 25 [Populus euphratica]
MLVLKLSIFLLSFAALTEAQEIFFLDHKCSNTTTFVRNSPYQANLNILLSSLAANATRNDINGFYNASTGHDVYEVYGLFLCRGDVSVEVCQECVNLARNDVVQRCPIQKEAIIRYEQCFLRYSNSNIFSSLSQTPALYKFNTPYITVDVEFNKLLVNTISDAVHVAASAPSGKKKSATKKEIYTRLESLYILVQCTPDLSKNDCNQCLLLAKLSISICCNNNRGRILFPSCNFRYENYSFYNQAAVVKGKLSIFLLSFAALTEAQEIFFLDHKCSNTTTFVRNSPYQANLNILLSSLAANATRNDINGFYNASTGHDVYDQVYGLFLCRGDVSVEVCQECVNLARNDVVQRCPIQKEAIIWYDQCFLRYSNSNIFSSLSQTPALYKFNTPYITVDVEFNKLLVNTISDAVHVAASAPSGKKKSATKKEIYTRLESLYILVQCTPDLSKNDCNQCLLLAKLSISICCNNNRGRILFPSCNFRYENYSFYNQAAVVAMSPPPLSMPVVLLPPSPGPIGDGTKSMWIKVGAGLSAVIAVLFFSACIYTKRRMTNLRTGHHLKKCYAEIE